MTEAQQFEKKIPKPEEYPDKYKLFRGRIIDNVPIIISEGREIISPKQIAELRLGRLGLPGDHNRYRNTYSSASFVVLKDPEGTGDIKLVHRHPLIYTLNPETRLVNHALPINSREYNKKDGFTIKSADAKKLAKNIYDLESVRRAILEFTLESQQLTKDYIEYIEKQTRSKFSNIMGFYPMQGDGMKFWDVDHVGIGSFAGSSYDLDGAGGLLVGVATESLSRSKNSSGNKGKLEDRVVRFDNNVISFDGDLYTRLPKNLVLKQ